jgi:hypothetical protein
VIQAQRPAKKVFAHARSKLPELARIARRDGFLGIFDFEDEEIFDSKIGLYDFELYADWNVLEKAWRLFETDCVKFSNADDEWNWNWNVTVRDGKLAYEVAVHFNGYANVECARGGCACGGNAKAFCEHFTAALFAIKDQFLGAASRMEPPDLFVAKKTIALEQATNEYCSGESKKSALSLVMDAVGSDPLDIGLGMSILLKEALHRKRIFDTRDVSSISDIAMMADDAARQGDLRLAADLEIIALDAFDSLDNLAWRGKGIASKEYDLVTAKLAVITNGLRENQFLSKHLMDAYVSAIKQARHEEAVYSLSKLALPICQSGQNRQKLKTLLSSIKIHLECDDMKELRLIIAANGEKRAMEAFLLAKIDEDLYYKSRYVDLLIESKSYMQAISICLEEEEEDEDYGYDWEWAEKHCNVLEKMGDMKRLREQRELMFNYMTEVDDADLYFENYDKLKKICSDKELKSVEMRFVNALKGPGYTYANKNELYELFLEEQGRISELYQIAASQLDRLPELYEKLIPEFKEEADRLVEEFIFEKAKPIGRANYEIVYECLWRFKEKGADVESVRKKLVAKYPNRSILLSMIGSMRLS